MLYNAVICQSILFKGKITIVSLESVRVFDSRIMIDVQIFIGHCSRLMNYLRMVLSLNPRMKSTRMKLYFFLLSILLLFTIFSNKASCEPSIQSAYLGALDVPPFLLRIVTGCRQNFGDDECHWCCLCKLRNQV